MLLPSSNLSSSVLKYLLFISKSRTRVWSTLNKTIYLKKFNKNITLLNKTVLSMKSNQDMMFRKILLNLNIKQFEHKTISKKCLDFLSN